MRLLHPRHTGRRGFTLIELLVVIAIIGILVGLTTAAVMKFLGKGPELQDRSDISQLADAVQRFQAKYGFYPPSRVFLANKFGLYNANNPLHQDSLKILNRMFPRFNWNPPNPIPPLDWSGGINKAALDSSGVTLEGDQCLVWFVGGIPQASGGVFGTQGFSTNQQYPTQPGGERLQFFNFQSSRLVNTWKLPSGATLSHANLFPAYLNAHQNQPYAYFSSYGRTNGYSPYGTSDCPTLGVVGSPGPPVPPPLMPYYETLTPTVRYLNPKTFQLISDGPDGLFGPGGQWTLATAGSTPQAGKDDISNFSGSNLGVAP